MLQTSQSSAEPFTGRRSRRPGAAIVGLCARRGGYRRPAANRGRYGRGKFERGQPGAPKRHDGPSWNVELAEEAAIPQFRPERTPCRVRLPPRATGGRVTAWRRCLSSHALELRGSRVSRSTSRRCQPLRPRATLSPPSSSRAGPSWSTGSVCSSRRRASAYESDQAHTVAGRDGSAARGPPAAAPATASLDDVLIVAASQRRAGGSGTAAGSRGGPACSGRS